jgi:hypothetical protein
MHEVLGTDEAPAALRGSGTEVGFGGDWAIPWSDLMMVMFVLFVVLFSYHAAEREVRSAFEPVDAPRFREPGFC